MTKKDFINRVMLVLNEAQMLDKDGTFYIGADTAQIDRYVEGAFTDAWRRCVNVLPAMWFESALLPISTSGTGRTHHFDSSQGTGYIDLPSNFYRLVKFRMEGWQKSVYEASLGNDRVANIQSNEYTRGSTIRPVCVLENIYKGTGEKQVVLHYYSLPKGLENHKVEEAIYMPFPAEISGLADDDSIDVDIRVLEPLAYLAASSVCTLLEKYEVAKALEQKVAEMFPALRNAKGTFKQ